MHLSTDHLGPEYLQQYHKESTKQETIDYSTNMSDELKDCYSMKKIQI